VPNLAEAAGEGGLSLRRRRDDLTSPAKTESCRMIATEASSRTNAVCDPLARDVLIFV
jgi:hypothetical protein